MMTINSTSVTPAQAYWNQREELAEFRPRAEQLQRAVDRLGELTTFQWAQLFVMALEFKPDLILELGRGIGNSTCVFTEAANRLGSCRVVSLDIGDSWEKTTVPRIVEIVPPSWFKPLNALQGNILTFDFEALFRDANRVLIFWDAHGFDIAECVLGRALPAIQNLPHLVMMHDMTDARYCKPEYAIPYGDNGLWKGANAGSARVLLGHISSAVAQSIAIVDFTSRNKLTLHSADHELHTEFEQASSRKNQLKELLGDELFSLTAHWFWLSLNEKPGPYTFPQYDERETQRKYELEERMKWSYELQGQMDRKQIGTKIRLKLAARILLNRYPKDFLNSVMWDIVRS